MRAFLDEKENFVFPKQSSGFNGGELIFFLKASIVLFLLLLPQSMKNWKRNTKRYIFWTGILMIFISAWGLEAKPPAKTGLIYFALIVIGNVMGALTVSWIDDKIE